MNNAQQDRHIGIGSSVNYIFKDNYVVGLGFSGYFFGSVEFPDDITRDEFFIFGPTDSIFTIDASFGRVFSFDKLDNMRFNLLAGIGFNTYNDIGNWTRGLEDPTYLGTFYYDNDIIVTNDFSLIVNSRFEFPIMRFLGASVSFSLKYQRDTIYTVSGFGLIIGNLRNK
ncbi:hypothetical protein OA501_01360 [Flavobacteriaceae bacterium]|nr:hypothetical protein [Flavobacteriaceae bacterium]